MATEYLEEQHRDDEPVGALTGEPGTVEPIPALPAEARTALADAISSTAQSISTSSGSTR